MPLTPEQAEHRETLNTAGEYLGESVLTEWEEQFVESCLDRIARDGEDWIATEKQAEILQRLRSKLEKAGLL